MQGAFTHNTRLQAKRMFEGIVDGSGTHTLQTCQWVNMQVLLVLDWFHL